MTGLATVYTRATQGLDSPLVSVEVHISKGMPGLSIVGLAETVVKESKDRVRSALINSQFEFPAQRITINLAPADLPKEGGRFDLPIAIGILLASKQIKTEAIADYEFSGELALSGELRPIKASLPLALATKQAQRKLILPRHNANEAALISEVEILPASHLLEVCQHLSGKEIISPFIAKSSKKPQTYDLDLADIKGQQHAKRALEIAAAGGHNLLMCGPPGTGKTMLANRLPTILPPLTELQAIEVASIYSIRGFDNFVNRFYHPPFRHPHHTASSTAMVGGGSYPKPGEISLAHYGVLFLDELPEFNRHVIEVLREPLESGKISLSRAQSQITYPAQFQLIAAMNPCPCGYFGSKYKECECTAHRIHRYKQKISGPLLDRIDMHINVSEVMPNSLSQTQALLESSTTVRRRVIRARHRQLTRQGLINRCLSDKLINKYCAISLTDQQFLESAATRLKFSARSYQRVLRLARSIADLADDDKISRNHLCEAISYKDVNLL